MIIFPFGKMLFITANADGTHFYRHICFLFLQAWAPNHVLRHQSRFLKREYSAKRANIEYKEGSTQLQIILKMDTWLYMPIDPAIKIVII